MPADPVAPSRKPRRTAKRAPRRPAKPAPAPAPPSTGSDFGLASVARQLRSWSDSVLGVAGAAADVSLGAAKAILVRPEQRRALEKTGHILRGMREATGLSLQEVGEAINLKDPSLLELVENGKVALPFEIILRLASVLGRNDPISFVMRFTRSYNPDTWHTLERLGIGRLALQVGREREFANIYRASDAARRLTDEEFAAVLGYMKASFDLAMAFHGARTAPAPAERRAKRG
jgi:transcriptional regulator with XRE-family HTH domain